MHLYGRAARRSSCCAAARGGIGGYQFDASHLHQLRCADGRNEIEQDRAASRRARHFAIYASAKRRQQCRYGRRYRCNAATGEKRMGGEGNDWSDEAVAETVGNFQRTEEKLCAAVFVRPAKLRSYCWTAYQVLLLVYHVFADAGVTQPQSAGPAFAATGTERPELPRTASFRADIRATGFAFISSIFAAQGSTRTRPPSRRAAICSTLPFPAAGRPVSVRPCASPRYPHHSVTNAWIRADY